MRKQCTAIELLEYEKGVAVQVAPTSTGSKKGPLNPICGEALSIL